MGRQGDKGDRGAPGLQGKLLHRNSQKKVSKIEYSFKVNLDAMGFLVHLARKENPATLEKR